MQARRIFVGYDQPHARQGQGRGGVDGQHPARGLRAGHGHGHVEHAARHVCGGNVAGIARLAPHLVAAFEAVGDG